MATRSETPDLTMSPIAVLLKSRKILVGTFISIPFLSLIGFLYSSLRISISPARLQAALCDLKKPDRFAIPMKDEKDTPN